MALIADIFKKKSTEGVYDFISSYNDNPLDSILSYFKNDEITQDLLLSKPSIDLITEKNVNELNEKSKEIRNKVRGQKIGNLG